MTLVMHALLQLDYLLIGIVISRCLYAGRTVLHHILTLLMVFVKVVFYHHFYSVFTCVSYAEARNSYRLDICPSVCPSVLSVSKRLNILSCFLRHTIAHSL